MRRPRGCTYEITFGVCLIHREVYVLSPREFHFWRAGWVCTAGTALQHARRGEQLRAMANRGDRLASLIERSHQCQHLLVQSQVFRCTAAGDHQGIVILRLYRGEIEVERKIMPGLFAVGLITLEIMDRRA